MHCASCGTPLPENALFCPGCGQRMSGQRPPPSYAPNPAPVPARAPAPRRPASAPTIPRNELDVAIAARDELGERLEPEVIDSFLDRVETSLDARIDARIGQRTGRHRSGPVDRSKAFTARVLGSLGLGIPLTAIAASLTDIPGVIAVWGAIVVLNIYYTENEKENK